MSTICFQLWTNCFDILSFFQACDSNPCLNGGKCIDMTNGKYSCDCADGWKGDQCESKGDLFYLFMALFVPIGLVRYTGINICIIMHN